MLLEEIHLARLNYPLALSFKIVSWGPQISVKDANGKERMYVHMKALKLKEEIGVFTDSSKSKKLFSIRADRVIDFSATYHFTDAIGNSLGAVKHEGMRSLYSASYGVIGNADNITHYIKEDSGWIHAADAVFREIPIVNIFAGYVFRPAYTLYQAGTKTPVLKISKKPAFFEGSYEITMIQDLGADEPRLILALLTMLLLEVSGGI